MNEAFFPDARPVRPIWLVTLADLALLLIGFFVLIQANQRLDKRALAQGFREGFGVTERVPEPMPVAVAAVDSFDVGSSVLPVVPAPVLAWARDSLRDPRVRLKISGAVDGSAGDVEAVTASGAMLAADRARAVAAALILAGAVPTDRVDLATNSAAGKRAVTLTLGFAGDRP